VGRTVDAVTNDGAETFRASADAYDAHIGRYGRELARGLIQLAGVGTTDLVVDVGCGTGLLTAELASAVGANGVSAVDPSESFVAACQERVPGADVRLARAEDLPFADAAFDRALSQLVVNFMSDARAGVRQMRRVTRRGGTVAASVWDYADGMTLLRTFWDAARSLDPGAVRFDEGALMPHCQPDSLRTLWEAGELRDIEVAELRPSVAYASFEELWMPFTSGVAPSGAYTVSLDELGQQKLHDELFRRLDNPTGAFSLIARAWAIVGSH
jgi:SAM-dependent methyltransferase